jgi:hypothetical protein
VDDENVLHWWGGLCEHTVKDALILVEMLSMHQIDALKA